MAVSRMVWLGGAKKMRVSDHYPIKETLYFSVQLGHLSARRAKIRRQASLIPYNTRLSFFPRSPPWLV